MRSRSPRWWLLGCAECSTDCVNARRPSRAAARLRCVRPHGCSGRRRARPLRVPVGGGPPASRPRRELRSAWRLEARPGPAAAHRHRGRSLLRPSHQWRLVAVNDPATPRRRPVISHVIPLRLFQVLNSGRWNCNVFGVVETLLNRITCDFSGDVAMPPPAGAAAGLGAGLTISHAIPSLVFQGLKSDRWNSADSNVPWGCALMELHAELREFPCPWPCLLLRGIALLG